MGGRLGLPIEEDGVIVVALIVLFERELNLLYVKGLLEGGALRR